MKKTVVVICLLAVILGGYCAAENCYLRSFSDRFEELLYNTQKADSIAKMKQGYQLLEKYLSKQQPVLDQLTPRGELEQIYISMGHLEDYLKVDNLPEARVAVGEILRILDDIRESPLV